MVPVQVEQLNSTDASTRHKVATFVRELEGEIRTLQKLKHPNIVQYLGFERTETHFNIFLEWIAGGSIGKLLDDFGAPHPPWASRAELLHTISYSLVEYSSTVCSTVLMKAFVFRLPESFRSVATVLWGVLCQERSAADKHGQSLACSAHGQIPS